MPTFTVESITNPIYTNADGTGIDAQIKFAEFDQVLPFHATSWDTELHGKQIYDDLIAGKYGPITPYSPDLTKIELSVRSQRNMLIMQTDWTQGADVPEATRTKWATYRQLLRDVPQQSGFPTNITWPTPPN